MARLTSSPKSNTLLMLNNLYIIQQQKKTG